jgi:phosphopantetheine adenylyltransferase
MAKSVEQELRELRQRVKQFEQKFGSSHDEVHELVNVTDPGGNPSRRSFADACDVAQRAQRAEQVQSARADFAANSGKYSKLDMQSGRRLAQKHQIDEGTAWEIIGG